MRSMTSVYFLLPLFTFGLCLFWLRACYLLVYGLLESCVASITLYISVVTTSSNLLAKAISLLGGTYVFVRALDNIDKGLPEKFRGHWDYVFRNKTPLRAFYIGILVPLVRAFG
jgi:hypothetical protein